MSSDSVRTVVLATANLDKAAELRRLLGALEGLRLVPRPADVPEVPEEAETLVGNARAKASALASATGLAALADDTGLFVDALGGAPGVRAARFAGAGATYADNVARLLSELGDTENRAASFRTVALLRWPDGRERFVEGVLAGRILRSPRGTSGFGYDPVFAPLGGDGRSLAELAPEEKDACSHRAAAVAGVARLLALP